MILNKVTVGFVVQQFDTELREFTSQEFIAEDEQQWEDPDTGEPVDLTESPYTEAVYGLGGVDEPSLPLEMVQPSGQPSIQVPWGDGVFHK